MKRIRVYIKAVLDALINVNAKRKKKRLTWKMIGLRIGTKKNLMSIGEESQ
jgi:hypothetical protein